MKIYVAHSKSFDFKKELYEPIRQSLLNDEHVFVLPHEVSDELFNSKDYLRHEADLMIAEVSGSTIGLGIEIGWADAYGVPILCVYRKGLKVSGSLRVVSESFVEYSDNKELILGIEQFVNEMR